MLHLCTHSDYNYLTFGLSMFESLCSTTKGPFTLHYLANDAKTHDKLKSINDPHILVYDIREFTDRRDFGDLSKNNVVEQSGQSMFHFALTPYFTYEILSRVGEGVVYVDSDICWFRGAEAVFDVCRGHDFGLATHKHMPLSRNVRNPGYYNVGVLYVSNKEQCQWWKNVTVDTKNKWTAQYGSCGDQKYLEALDEVFPDIKIKVMDVEIGHGAPWNMFLQQINFFDHTITWTDKHRYVINGATVTLPFYFFHFAHCTPDFVRNTVGVDRCGEWGGHIDTNKNDIKQLYGGYMALMINTRKKYAL